MTEVATLSMARAKTRPTRTAVSIQQSASSSARLHSGLFIGAARREEGVSQIIPTGQFWNPSRAGRRDRYLFYNSVVVCVQSAGRTKLARRTRNMSL